MPEQDGSRRKLVIVERKLVRNRGHQHTQIGALQKMLPGHDLHLVTGEDYDGFLGEATARISARSRELSRLRWRIGNGSLRQKIDAVFRAALSGQFLSLPKTPYGRELSQVCDNLDLNTRDLLIVPSADLEALESACQLVDERKDRSPRLVLRFLDPELGEHKTARREERLGVLSEILSRKSNLSLFCETEEMAAHLNVQYGLDVQGGFYLPCSFDPALPPEVPTTAKSDLFRVGLFGAPRPGKGYERIGGITDCLRELLKQKTASKPIEIILQGSERDFAENGAYNFVQEMPEESGILFSRHSDRLDPDTFIKLFLSADLILLPYDTDVYGLQGSGIIQDAISTEKVIVHSKGIAMKQLLSGGNAHAASSDAGFAKAINDVVTTRSKNLRVCRDARLHYLNILKNNILSKGEI